MTKECVFAGVLDLLAVTWKVLMNLKFHFHSTEAVIMQADSLSQYILLSIRFIDDTFHIMTAYLYFMPW